MISKCGWKFGLPSFCLCNHCGMQSEGSCVAWAKLLLSVMRTYLWVILGSWMLQGLCSFLLALRQGSPVHSNDRGACSKLPDLYCCTYRSLHLLWELLNWTQLALSFFIACHPTSSFLFSPVLPSHSSYLPSFFPLPHVFSEVQSYSGVEKWISSFSFELLGLAFCIVKDLVFIFIF